MHTISLPLKYIDRKLHMDTVVDRGGGGGGVHMNPPPQTA